MSILTLLQLVPLIGTLGLFLVPKANLQFIKQIALAVSLIDLVLSVSMAMRFDRNEIGRAHV